MIIAEKVVQILLIGMVLISCKPAVPFSYTPIYGDLNISQNEQEIIFPNAFRPVKQVNEVCFAYLDEVSISNINEMPKFMDGGEMRIDAILVDQKDDRVLLKSIGRNSPNYLCLVPSDFSAWLDISNQNIEFKKLTVRSQRPIHVQRIEWESYNGWDLK